MRLRLRWGRPTTWMIGIAKKWGRKGAEDPTSTTGSAPLKRKETKQSIDRRTQSRRIPSFSATAQRLCLKSQFADSFFGRSEVGLEVVQVCLRFASRSFEPWCKGCLMLQSW